MAEFEAAFAEKYNVPLCPGQYGFPGLTNLITALCDDFVIRGRGSKKMICIAQPGKNNAVSIQRNSFNIPSNSMPMRSGPMPSRLSTPRYDAFRMVQPPNSHLNHEHSRYRGQSTSSSSSWMGMPPRRHRPITQHHSQMHRFSQPPPQTSSTFGGLGFGGSSGPGCGGGDFWAELAQFGIYPNPNPSSNLVSGSSARSIFNSTTLGRMSTSPACGSHSPISSPGMDGKTTSMLPTPHSPSPLLHGNKGATHFAFPPTNFWPNNGQDKSGSKQSAVFIPRT